MATQTGRNVRVEIAATYSAAKTVTAVTKASPGVAASAAHGMTDGTIGYFSDDTAGMEELAGAAFSVDSPITGNFNLEGEDTTTYGTFTSGTFIPVATWTTLSTATSYEISDSAPDQVDTTTLLSRIKQQEAGLLAAQTISFGNLSDAQLSAFTLIKNAAKANGGYVVGRITLSNGERRIFRGQPSLPGESMTVGQKATNNLTILVKGFVGMLPA
jgi:hypothetical protein